MRLLAQKVVVNRRAEVLLDGTNYSFGENVVIGAFSYVCVGPDQHDAQFDGGLFIGHNVYIGEWNNIRAVGGVIRIGDDTMISQMVSIIAANHGTRIGAHMRTQPLARARTGVTIGADVWIGAGATLLPGATVGDGAIVGAGAVVTGDVPAGAVVAGVPARQIGQREA